MTLTLMADGVMCMPVGEGHREPCTYGCHVCFLPSFDDDVMIVSALALDFRGYLIGWMSCVRQTEGSGKVGGSPESLGSIQ